MAEADPSRRGAQAGVGSAKVTWPLRLTGVCLFAAALIALVVGVSLWTPGPQWDWLWNLNPSAHAAFAPAGRLLSALFVCLSGVAGVAGFGLIQARRWAWRMAVGIFAVNGVGDGLALFRDQNLARPGTGLLIAGLFVVILTRADVRRTLR